MRECDHDDELEIQTLRFHLQELDENLGHLERNPNADPSPIQFLLSKKISILEELGFLEERRLEECRKRGPWRSGTPHESTSEEKDPLNDLMQSMFHTYLNRARAIFSLKQLECPTKTRVADELQDSDDLMDEALLDMAIPAKRLCLWGDYLRAHLDRMVCHPETTPYTDSIRLLGLALRASEAEQLARQVGTVANPGYLSESYVRIQELATDGIFQTQSCGYKEAPRFRPDPQAIQNHVGQEGPARDLRSKGKRRERPIRDGCAGSLHEMGRGSLRV